MKKQNDIFVAMQAIEKALRPFSASASAMAVCGIAGVYAAQPETAIYRFAGLGVNIEAMVSAFTSTVEHNAKRRAKRKRKVKK